MPAASTPVTQACASENREREPKQTEKKQKKNKQDKQHGRDESDGIPLPPAGWEGLPATRVSAAALDAFRIPPFLLPIYQAAGIQYGVNWEILAAINEIETNNGLNMNISTAGALGWMQFMPATWRVMAWTPTAMGCAIRTTRSTRSSPPPATCVPRVPTRTSVRRSSPTTTPTGTSTTSCAARGDRRAAGTAGRRAHRPRPGPPASGCARACSEGTPGRPLRHAAHPLRRPGGRIVDGRVTRIGHSNRLGNYLELQDVYGNLFTYAHLGRIAATHPVPRRGLNADAPALPADDPAPTTAASDTTITPTPTATATAKRRCVAKGSK